VAAWTTGGQPAFLFYLAVVDRFGLNLDTRRTSVF
jgi:hypothetical protein